MVRVVPYGYFFALVLFGRGAFAAAPAPSKIRTYLEAHCLDCHEGTDAKAGLDLSTHGLSLGEAATFDRWVRIYDRVSSGEMPPGKRARPATSETKLFLGALADPLVASDRARIAAEGRATRRRLNRFEYEETLRDLLAAPWLAIKDVLPEDGEAFRFNKVGEALDVSHVQMAQYLAAADQAMRDVIVNQAGAGASLPTRYYAREMGSMVGHIGKQKPHTGHVRWAFPVLGHEAQPEVRARTAPLTVGAADPIRRDLEGVAFVHGAYEPIEPRFDKFKAPRSGRYRLRVSAQSLWVGAQKTGPMWWNPDMDVVSRGHRAEPVTLYGERPPTVLRRLGAFDAGPDGTVATFETDLLAGETIRMDASRFFRSRPARNPNRPLGSAFRNPLATREGQPAVAYRWVEVEGPLAVPAGGSGVARMFDDLQVHVGPNAQIEVVPKNPLQDVRRLIGAFLRRASRKPAAEADAKPFIAVTEKALAAGDSFADALLAGYAAVLCSPGFLYLGEQPGPLDSWAVATRLSYFLWNAPPDDHLRDAAVRNELLAAPALQRQAQRLLDDPRARRFVDAFLDYWLDLRRIGNNSPDAVLYPDYNLDDQLTESAAEEPRRFFAELLRRDRPARNIIDSDFLIVNERLATHYGLRGAETMGVDFGILKLPKGSVRGGFLTQAGVLKVTSNGTTTSPVVRGAWIGERLLGMQIPPPPPGTPAVEPDIRGAQTIREQLAKHRADKLCASCHNKIDPAGFALEAFDVFGGQRTTYRAMGEGSTPTTGIGKDGIRYEFHDARPVDPSGVLPNGARFDGVSQLRRALLRDQRQIARNLVRQLVTYATGAPVRFGDRIEVEAILDRAARSQFGVRSLIFQIISSELFRNK